MTLKKKKRLKLSVSRSHGTQLLARANVTYDKEGWAMVPGELLKAYNDKYIYERKEMTRAQEDEYVRYLPCLICGAAWSVSCCERRRQKP